MHSAEQWFLATLIPATVLIATWYALQTTLGGLSAWLFALPAALLLLHILPLILLARSPRTQWWCWLTAATLWAWFHRDAPAFIATFAWGWLAIAGANILSVGGLALRSSMKWQGRGGITWRAFLLIIAHAIAIAIGWHFGWHWAFLIGAAIAAVCCLAVFRPNSQWLGSIIRQSHRNPLLTFDDGPHPESTIPLLNLLDRRGEKAIFFLIGENARRHPHLAREIAKRGHEIGNHTLTHPQATFWCAGPSRTAREIRECQFILHEITGITPRYFRAPVGHRNLFTHPIAASLGLEIVGWSRRGYDADPNVPANQVISRITSKLRPRDIVLLHEGRPDAPTIAAAILDSPTFSPPHP